MLKLFIKPKAKIIAPLTGKAIPIKDVPDPVFSEKVLGDGIAIIPEKGRVLSPVNGTIAQIAHTLHAIGIESDDGLEVLVHIGLDTVALNGDGFNCRVKHGQKVRVGDLLMEVDLEKVKANGRNTVSPIIITNSDSISIAFNYGSIIAGKTPIITYKRK